MSYEYFGLREEAFGIIPDVRFIYLDAARMDLSAQVTSGIHQGKGLMLLTANRGMGKTMMLRYLAAKLQSDDEFDLLARNGVLSCDSGPSFNDILITCRERFGVFDEGADLDCDESDFVELLKLQSTVYAPSALLLDGVEHLSDQSLESIVALAALPAEERGYLSIVLAACPDSPARPISATLSVLQRLPDVNVQLERLPDYDVEPFILHRLQIAGHDGSALFAPDAIDQIIRSSEGNPLAINRICRSAMVIASHQTSRTVSAPMVQSALMVEEVANGRRGRASGDRSTSKTARPVGPSDMEKFLGAPTESPVGPSDMEQFLGAPTESIEIPERPPGPAGYVSGATRSETQDPGGSFHFADKQDSGVGNTFDIENLASFPNRLPGDDFVEDKHFSEKSLQRIEFLLRFVRQFLEKSAGKVDQFAVKNKPRLKFVWQFLKNLAHRVVQLAVSHKSRLNFVWTFLNKWFRGASQVILANKPRTFVVSIVFGILLFVLVSTASFFYDSSTDSSPEFKQAVHEPLTNVDRRSAQSYYQLGRSFEEGRGFPRDLAMAHAWYALAAAQGSPEATRARDILASQMTSEELVEAQRLAVKWTPVGEMEMNVSSAALNSLPSNTTADSDAAVSDGDATVVSNHLAAGLDPDAIDGNGETSPNRAVESGNSAVIEAVQDAGAKVDAPGNEERKPLNTAAAGREDGVAPRMQRNTDPPVGEGDGTAAANPEHVVTRPMERNTDPAVGDGDGTAAAGREHIITLLFERSGGPPLREADGTVVSDPVPDKGDPASPVSGGTENGTSQMEPDVNAFDTAAGHEDTAGSTEFDTVSREKISRDLLAVTTPEEAPQPEEASRPEEISRQASRQPAASPTDTPAERTDDRAAAVAASRKIQQAKIKPDNEATARAPSPEPSRSVAKSVETQPVRETRVKTAQYLLSRLGYDPGPADGLAGPNTRAAVRAYQRDKGEAADGRITEDLVNRLSGEVVAEEARRLAEIEKRREMEPALNRRRENKTVWANILGGFQKVLGYEFDSTKNPEELIAYCSKSLESWVYDFGTEQFVLCRDFVQRQSTVSR